MDILWQQLACGLGVIFVATIITFAIEKLGIGINEWSADGSMAAGCSISSPVDNLSSPGVDIAATVSAAASLGQRSHSQEKQTQAEHHRSLHTWIVQMVLMIRIGRSPLEN